MEVTINNKTSLDLLNNTLDTLHSLMEKYEVDPYDPNQHLISPGLEDWDDVEKTIQCTTEEFLKTNHWNNYNDHIGYPVEFRAYPIEHMSAKSQEFYDFWAYLKYEMPAELGATANALCAYYPNNGLTGWHTNWNANAYQFLFTWSENGDGFFRYYDKKNEKIVTIPDKPGWQCRWYYFGKKDEPEDHCWHCCYTGKSRRMTLALKVQNELSDQKGKYSKDDSIAQMLRDDLVAELESHE